MRKTDSDRYSLIKGQGQLSANIIAGEGNGIMNNDFTHHVYDRKYLFCFRLYALHN